ncbi:MAG: glycosyltransferase family 87 protein [Chloroflexota bacterium]
MQLQPRPKQILLAVVMLLLFLGLVIAFQITFTSQVPGANDFYPRWRGAQLFWQSGIDPYSEEATAAIQRDIYGRLAQPDEDQVLFVYPFYTVFILWPLIWLPYVWVQAIWLVVLLFALVGGVISWLRLLEWRPPLWLLAITLLWAVLYYSSTRTIILGQFAGLVFLGLVGCLLALKQKQDGVAGLLLALTTLKPQMVFLVIPALLIWGMGQRRTRFLIGFLASLAVLMGVSFVLLPTWLSSFINQILAYPTYTVLGNPLQIITTLYLPFLDPIADYMLRGILLIFLLWNWYKLPTAVLLGDTFLFIISLTLVVSNLIAPQTATTNYVVLYLPLLWLLKTAVVYRPTHLTNLLIAAFYLFSIVVVWFLFLQTVSGNAENSVMFIPLPLSLLLILLLLHRET